MRKYLSILFFCLLANLTFGQDNLQVQFGYKGSISGARYLPATHYLDSSKFDINLSYSLWAANSSLTYSSMQTIVNNNRITNEEINGFIDEMDEENKVSFGQDFLILGLGFKHNMLGKPIMWNFSISDRFLANTIYPQALPQLIWQGNKQFEGETVDLSSTFMTGLYFREFVVGFNRAFIQKENHVLKGALRVKYLLGIAGLDLDHSDIAFTTFEDGDSILLDYNLAYNHSGLANFNLFEAKGHGYGIDMGLSYNYKDRWSFDMGLVDFGEIFFDKETTSLDNDAYIKFTGFNEYSLENTTVFFDSIAALMEPHIGSGQKFSTRLGAKFSLMVSYKVKRSTLISSHKELHFSYRQGLSEAPGTTRTPKVSLAFSNVMFRYIDAGMNVSWGGFKKYSVGALIGLRLKHFQLGIYSDDFTGFVAPDKATGAGLGVFLRWRLFSGA